MNSSWRESRFWLRRPEVHVRVGDVAPELRLLDREIDGALLHMVQRVFDFADFAARPHMDWFELGSHDLFRTGVARIS